MKIGSDLLVPDSSKVLLYRGLRPVYYHIARARIITVNQYHCIVIPVLNTILSASSSAIRLCKAKVSLLRVSLLKLSLLKLSLLKVSALKCKVIHDCH